MHMYKYIFYYGDFMILYLQLPRECTYVKIIKCLIGNIYCNITLFIFVRGWSVYNQLYVLIYKYIYECTFVQISRRI